MIRFFFSDSCGGGPARTQAQSQLGMSNRPPQEEEEGLALICMSFSSTSAFGVVVAVSISRTRVVPGTVRGLRVDASTQMDLKWDSV